VIFGSHYLRRTITMSALLTVSIIGLWAAAVYEPTAIVFLSRQAGMAPPDAAKMASYGTGLLSIGTILGLLSSALARRAIRSAPDARALLCRHDGHDRAGVWLGVLLTDWLGAADVHRVAVLLGLFGGNFAIFSLWLPELFGTEARATAFSFCTSVGRFIGAGVNFGLAGARGHHGHAWHTCRHHLDRIRVGLFIIPLALETRGETLPE